VPGGGDAGQDKCGAALKIRTSLNSITEISRKKNSSKLATIFRSVIAGPEALLLKGFLRDLPIKVPRAARITLFREPRLESGYPDAVIVIWKPSIARKWNPRRNDLRADDFRLLHLIYQQRGVREVDLAEVPGKSIVKGLERLQSAGLINKRSKKWVLRRIDTIFAPQEIIAIEAKVGNSKKALAQANLNTWFASHSYILTPPRERWNGLEHEAKRLGLGIWTFAGTPRVTVKARKMPLPRSYASWLLNEWVCSTAHRRKDL
jgi:hypothetical protein